MGRKTDFDELIRSLEDDLRQGTTGRVAQRLHNLNLKRVPREHRLKLAQAFRRCGLTDHAFRVLTPVMRGSLAEAPATAAEAVEYSFCLIRGGSVDEARETLEAVSETEEPKKLFALAFCHISQWDYRPAIPLLRRYLELIPADKYQHLVVKVNLAAAQVHVGDARGASESFAFLKPLCEKQNLHRLAINLKELEAQLRLDEGDLTAAEKLLNEAAAAARSEDVKDLLFIRKWSAVIAAIKAGSAAPIEEFKKTAVEKRHWESVRDCDFQILKHGLSRAPLEHLYYGTPFETYKQDLERRFGSAAASHDWNGPAGRTFCLSSGKEERQAVVNLGKNNHRLLDLLSRDFYRPIPVGAIFQGLFPDEKFNVFSSVNRVHQAVTRLRRWMKQNDIPMHIEERDGEYRLRFTGDYALRRSKSVAAINAVSVFEKKVSDTFGPRLFSRKEAETALATSASSAHRILSDLVESEVLVRQGVGAQTKYRWNTGKKAA